MIDFRFDSIRFDSFARTRPNTIALHPITVVIFIETFARIKAEAEEDSATAVSQQKL